MILTINDFVLKHKLKNKATSNIKIYEVLKSIGLDTKVEIHLRRVVSKRYWNSQFTCFKRYSLGLLYKRKLF